MAFKKTKQEALDLLQEKEKRLAEFCLLYTSDAADDRIRVRICGSDGSEHH